MGKARKEIVTRLQNLLTPQLRFYAFSLAITTVPYPDLFPCISSLPEMCHARPNTSSISQIAFKPPNS